MNKTMAILVAVLVVAAGAVAAFTLIPGDDDKVSIPEVAEGTGTVYGNADGNCFIDKVDVAIAESIINGERTLEEFPFADADCSGTVDSKDVQLIKDMINKKDMKVKVLDTQDKIISVQYPIKNPIVLSGSNLAPLMNILDFSDIVVGAAYNTLDPVRDYSIYNGIESGKITKIGVNGTAADLDIVSELILKKDADVMLCEYSGMYDLDSDVNITQFNEWGLDVLCMECRDPGDDMRSLAVFGILLDRGENVQDYMKFCDEVYKDIKKVEGDKFGTTTVLVSSLKGSLSGTGSGYYPMSITAGGKNLADWSESTKSVKVGDVWIFEDKYASDVLLLGASSNYGLAEFTDSDIAAYEERYTNHNAWKNDRAFIFSTSTPVVVRIAYMAEFMYPDLFEDGWANGIHQDFVDKYFDTDYTVEESRFIKKLSS